MHISVFQHLRGAISISGIHCPAGAELRQVTADLQDGDINKGNIGNTVGSCITADPVLR